MTAILNFTICGKTVPFTAWHTAEMDSAQNFHIETTYEVLFLKNAYGSLSRAIFRFFVLTNHPELKCAHFYSECSIVGYGTGASRICELGQFKFSISDLCSTTARPTRQSTRLDCIWVLTPPPPLSRTFYLETVNFRLPIMVCELTTSASHLNLPKFTEI